MVTSDIASAFGHYPRIRVCGVAIDHNRILLINHSGITTGDWWAPPGGGVRQGEKLSDALIREFKEETGLSIALEKLLYVTEHIEAPLHAVELFFKVSVLSGKLTTGLDPELPADKQIIREVKYVTFKELSIMPDDIKHQYLRGVHNVRQILDKKGYIQDQGKNIK